MKTRKHGVYAALVVVLLITAALVISCPEFLDLDGLPLTQTGENSPPPGKSYVRLSFGGNERTIMPATTLSNFVDFVVNIYETSTPANTVAVDDVYTGTTALQGKSFTVETGKNYTVKVDAYMATFEGDSTDVIAASGTATTGTISSSTTVSIALKEKSDASVNGTFTWSLTYNSTNFSALTTATMGIYKLADNTLVGSPTDLKSNATGAGATATLPSGEYRVVVTLNGGANFQEDIQTFILHIYNGMTSSWTHDFTVLNNIAYTVTFTNFNGTGNTATNPVSGYIHGDLLNKSGTYPYTTLPTYTGVGTFSFAAWYSADQSAGAWDSNKLVDPTTYRIFKTQPLYARWNDTSTPPTAGVTVTFTLVDAGSTLDLNTAASISQDALITGSTLSLTVTGAATGSTYSWMFKGAQVSTTDTFVIEYDPANSATFQYLIVGEHTISVEVTTPAPDGKIYSTEFPLTIN